MTAPKSPLQIAEETLDLAKAATPGPWEIGKGVEHGLPSIDAARPDGDAVEICELWGGADWTVADDECNANARYIAFMREAGPALASSYLALVEERDRMRELVDCAAPIIKAERDGLVDSYASGLSDDVETINDRQAYDDIKAMDAWLAQTALNQSTKGDE